MAKANTIGGVLLILFGGYYIYEASKLPLWTDVGPGAGALPLFCGSLFVIFAILLTVKYARTLAVSAARKSIFTRWRVAVIIFGLLFFAALLAKLLGLIIVIFLFSVCYLIIVERSHPISAFIISLAITGLFYVVFQWLLDVPLSMGDLKMWLER